MPWTKIPSLENQDNFSIENNSNRILSYSEAIREALYQAMKLDESVFVMGQGVDDPFGMFGSTINLQKEFGEDRVFDTPLAENGLTGISVGCALGGMKPIYFHNRPDFLFLAMDQLVNHASKWHYMFGEKVNVPLVIWACVGRGWGSAAQHSQALQGMFMHVPGLKLIMPSTPYDAKGMLLSAISDPNPVLIIEHRFNFKYKGIVPEEIYKIPFGKGVIRRIGKDATIVGASYIINQAYEAASQLYKEDNIDVEVIDLRSLNPIDEKIIKDSLSKTGRLLVVDTGWKTCGVASEIISIAVEKCFSDLKCSPTRLTCPDTPTPAGFILENSFYPGVEEIKKEIKNLLTKER